MGLGIGRGRGGITKTKTIDDAIADFEERLKDERDEGQAVTVQLALVLLGRLQEHFDVNPEPTSLRVNNIALRDVGALIERYFAEQEGTADNFGGGVTVTVEPLP